jgi:hypothetical protein
MAEERNTRRELLRRVLSLGPLAALAAVFGVNGARPAQAADFNEDVIINEPYKLGIGTSAPTAPLHVKTNGLANVRVETTLGTDRAMFYLWGPSLGGLSNYWGMELNGGDNSRGFYNAQGHVYFKTYAYGGWREALAMVDVGYGVINVGIGTANPVAKLDVAGDIRLTGTLQGVAQRSYYDQ